MLASGDTMILGSLSDGNAFIFDSFEDLVFDFQVVSQIILEVGFGGAVFLFLFRLQQLKSLVTVCPWSKTIRDGDEWIPFEDFLHRRFAAVSGRLLRYDLKKLQNAGLVKKLGVTRGAAYQTV